MALEQLGEGFLLTRRVVNTRQGDCIEMWLHTKDGPLCLHSAPQTPICFVDQTDKSNIASLIQQHNLAVSIEVSSFKSLQQSPMLLLRCQRERDFFQLRRVATEQQVTLFETDIKLADRFLMERFAYGAVRYKAHQQAGQFYLSKAEVRSTAFRPQLSMLSLDIECDETGRLYSVGLASEHHGEVILIAPEREHAALLAAQQSDDFSLTLVHSEIELLQQLCSSVKEQDPDVLCGWNVKQFDFAILNKRAKACGIRLPLGRNDAYLEVLDRANDQVFIELPGRAIVDGIEGLKNMTYHFDSFALNAVAEQLLGQQKLVHEDDQLAAIKHLYATDKLTLAKYNIQDCRLVLDIFAHTKLLDFLCLRSDLTGLELGRPGGSVAAFLNLYLPHTHRCGYVSPNRPSDGGLASPGGYVMNSKPGLYEHILVLDFKSLYPSIIRTFCIDPVGLAEGMKHPQQSISGFKGAHFSRTTHFLPSIIESLWQQRDQAKLQQDQPRSQAIKILMNSLYGVLGSGGCPFYDPRLASSITLRGHEIMQTTAQWIHELGYEVIYGDTDSTFVWLEKVDNDEDAKLIGSKLATTINQRWQQRLKDEMQLTCYLEIEFETHFRHFFMPTIRGSNEGSKKRYAGLIEHGNEAQLVFKGLENVRSDWTALAKTFQYELYWRVFHQQPLSEFLAKTHRQLLNGELDAQLVYQKRLRKPLAAYTKTMPPHVKAATLLAKHKPAIASGKHPIRYLQTIDGPQPEGFITSLIDYQHYIDKQLLPIAESLLPYTDEQDALQLLEGGQLNLF